MRLDEMERNEAQAPRTKRPTPRRPPAQLQGQGQGGLEPYLSNQGQVMFNNFLNSSDAQSVAPQDTTF